MPDPEHRDELRTVAVQLLSSLTAGDIARLARRLDGVRAREAGALPTSTTHPERTN